MNTPAATLLTLIATDATGGRLLAHLGALTPEALETEALAAGRDLVDHLEIVVDALDQARAAFRGVPELLEARIAFRRKAGELETWADEIGAFRRVEAATARRVGAELADAQVALAQAVELHRHHRDAISEGRVAIARRRVTVLERDLAAWTR